MNRIGCRGWIFGFFVAFAAVVSHGQEKGAGELIVIGETIELPSKHLQRELTIDVCLPQGYAKGGNDIPCCSPARATSCMSAASPPTWPGRKAHRN